MTNNGTLSSFYLSQDGHAVGFDLNFTSGIGSYDGVYVNYAGTGNAVDIYSSSSSADNALRVENARTNVSAVFVKGIGQGVEIGMSVNSSNNLYGLITDLGNAGSGLEYAFRFNGAEAGAMGASGNGGFVSSSRGTFTLQGFIRIYTDGNTYYIPYGSVA
jgi:hypothetical protein